MLHVVPILCLLFFIGFVEIQLKNELRNVEAEFKDLKKRLKDLERKILQPCKCKEHDCKEQL